MKNTATIFGVIFLNKCHLYFIANLAFEWFVYSGELRPKLLWENESSPIFVIERKADWLHCWKQCMGYRKFRAVINGCVMVVVPSSGIDLRFYWATATIPSL